MPVGQHLTALSPPLMVCLELLILEIPTFITSVSRFSQEAHGSARSLYLLGSYHKELRMEKFDPALGQGEIHILRPEPSLQ